jgi:Uma2 family endonuclease
MVAITFGVKTTDLPYTIRLYGVTEELFDELVDEDTRAELFDGVMIVRSPASIRHDEVAGFIRTLMSLYADEKDLGRVLGPDSLVHLKTCRKFGPDAYFIRQRRVPKRMPKEWQGAPDLVVEVLSPSNRREDLDDKRPAYHEAGVGEVWLVDLPNEQVLVDRRRRRRYVTEVVNLGKVQSTVLEGFWLDVSWLWAEPLPKRTTCFRKILSES